MNWTENNGKDTKPVSELVMLEDGKGHHSVGVFQLGQFWAERTDFDRRDVVRYRLLTPIEAARYAPIPGKQQQELFNNAA